jgi:hypothetical protein
MSDTQPIECLLQISTFLPGREHQDFRVGPGYERTPTLGASKFIQAHSVCVILFRTRHKSTGHQPEQILYGVRLCFHGSDEMSSLFVSPSLHLPGILTKLPATRLRILSQSRTVIVMRWNGGAHGECKL